MGCLHTSAVAAQAKPPDFEKVKTQSTAGQSLDADAVGPSIVWQYLQDINTALWRAYPAQVSQQMNSAYNTQIRKCQIRDTLKNTTYEMDFDQMTETDVVTGWQRKIRIEPQVQKQKTVSVSHSAQQATQHMNEHSHSHSHNNNSSKRNKNAARQLSNEPHFDINPLLENAEQPRYKQQASQSSPTGTVDDAQQRRVVPHTTTFKWQWYSESIGWKDYDDKLSVKIDEAFEQKCVKYAFKIRSNNTKYEIDFQAMKQSNLDTQKLRIIRRVPIAAQKVSIKMNDMMNVAMQNDMVIKGDDDDDGDEDDDANNEIDLTEVEDVALHERFQWEYFDDATDKWMEYGDNVSLKIETVYHSQATVARMKIHGVETEIRLNELPMNQCNLKSGKLSQIRRMIVDKSRRDQTGKHVKRPSKMKNSIHMSPFSNFSSAAESVQNGGGGKAVWRYKQGANLWHDYPPDICEAIESAYRGEQDRLRFAMNNEQYEIQFLLLTQINLSTKAHNDIARIDSKAAAAAAAASSLSASQLLQQALPLDEERGVNRAQTVNVFKRNDLDLIIEQQRRAERFFNKQHVKKGSLFADSDIAKKIAPDAQTGTFVWQWKDDANVWIEYEPNVSTVIEQAYLARVETMEIEKHGVVYEIRLQHNLECHFGTNRMRPIRRQRIAEQAQPQIRRSQSAAPSSLRSPLQQAAYLGNALNAGDDDFADEFDALTNKLEAAHSLSSDGGHDDDEKDIEYNGQSFAHTKVTQQHQVQPMQYTNVHQIPAMADPDHDDSDSEHNEQENLKPTTRQISAPETPADSEFTHEYGNDYNSYMKKFNNLNQGFM
mmetsp:Transcript_49412/g.82233  ORF Transcript_49412/g.82233 Transcript_49412/m.82233 type:complete len:825 (+) Transcript_49412:41-2515(+)